MSGKIDVFNGTFAPVDLRANVFAAPPGLPAGLAPFNVQNLGGRHYLTYALPSHAGQGSRVVRRRLIGRQFSYGFSEINAFDPITGACRSTLAGANGILLNEGLRALDFDNGGNGGDPNTLYFAARESRPRRMG